MDKLSIHGQRSRPFFGIKGPPSSYSKPYTTVETNGSAGWGFILHLQWDPMGMARTGRYCIFVIQRSSFIILDKGSREKDRRRHSFPQNSLDPNSFQTKKDASCDWRASWSEFALPKSLQFVFSVVNKNPWTFPSLSLQGCRRTRYRQGCRGFPWWYYPCPSRQSNRASTIS